MSVVRINAITVPPERAEEFERRFAARAGEVATMDGFEAFEHLFLGQDPLAVFQLMGHDIAENTAINQLIVALATVLFLHDMIRDD